MAAQKTQTPPARSSIRNAYLVLYNAASAAAWAVILTRTITIFTTRGPAAVPDGVATLTQWTQTAACLEILHSLLGIVPSPIATTMLQVLARCAVLWGYVRPFPASARHPAYTSMLLAWSITEVVRYTYFVSILNGFKPKWLVWLRYSMFYVLYPIGFLSECAMVYLAAGPLKQRGEAWPYISYFCLSLYVPGSYVLYTYMMKQRRKVLRNLKSEEVAKKK
ncbi:tyrosine phosphatase-like protein [Plectosphaerella cucumerina]|uniref:Very-long-chain (3R)-3-hydroxyacyl-CoA dehydratase n=1 Tax=Plectosphaerella cucumerina TaxID=40658 RepID=A0A8K0WZL1_9PEZI|nr:tyrosine phosphatase-like protein [Plectosphaerella cucumerina]